MSIIQQVAGKKFWLSGWGRYYARASQKGLGRCRNSGPIQMDGLTMCRSSVQHHFVARKCLTLVLFTFSIAP